MTKRDFIKQLSITSISALAAPSAVLSACGVKTSAVSSASTLDLPPLPYGYADLEPVIDSTTMELHHSKHHQGYVNKLKAGLGDADEVNFEELFSRDSLNDTLRNNGGGHFNHSLFWESLAPGGKGPSKSFIAVLKKDFGSMDELKVALINGGKSVFGSGWVWLIKDRDGRLRITTTPNQDNPLMRFSETRGTPLLGIDVWEHAYYLKYRNSRGKYLESIMDILNWEIIEKRFEI